MFRDRPLWIVAHLTRPEALNPMISSSKQLEAPLQMQTAHEMFIHELTDMLDAEQNLVEALGKQAEESSRPELQKAFQSHQAQTEKQVERLQQCFELLGESPEDAECKGIRGLIAEHDTFVGEEDPAGDLLDIFNTVAAAKVESYEIQAYQSLIRLADLMKHTKVSRLLNQSLKEEQATLKKVEGFSKKLKPENLGMEEEAEDESDSRKAPRGNGSKPRRGRAA
jgi:ferritin-like metal-binding protein YciE